MIRFLLCLIALSMTFPSLAAAAEETKSVAPLRLNASSAIPPDRNPVVKNSTSKKRASKKEEAPLPTGTKGQVHTPSKAVSHVPSKAVEHQSARDPATQKAAVPAGPYDAPYGN